MNGTNPRRRILTAVIIPVAFAVIALGLFAGLSGEAHATTADCKSALGSQCSTFAGHDNESVPAAVYWDVRGKTAAAGAPVIGYSADSTSDAATDFTKVQHIGHVSGVGLSDASTKSYSFVYTPGGHWSSLCVADIGTGLVLRACNGLQWQRFFADRDVTTASAPRQIGVGGFNGDAIYSSSVRSYALQNAASRDFVTDNSGHAPGTRPAGADDRQLVGGTAGATLNGNQVWDWQA